VSRKKIRRLNMKEKEINLPSWYKPRKEDLLILRALMSQNRGMRALILFGPPGVGKTALAHAVASALNAEEIYFLAHHWVSEEDLFVKLDPARVAGLAGGIYSEIEESYRPGVLLRAALSSQEKPTVLVLDEWDKAPERCDALLLEFLQEGKVYGPFGECWEALSENLLVFITSNEMRDLSEPLLRRCLRYRMGFLPPDVEADLIRKESGVPPTVARLIVGFMNIIRKSGATAPSLQEGVRLAQTLKVAESAFDVKLLIEGWLCKTLEDWEALEKEVPQPHTVLWGEMKKVGVK
jgi:MoxR-like ATPase